MSITSAQHSYNRLSCFSFNAQRVIVEQQQQQQQQQHQQQQQQQQQQQTYSMESLYRSPQ